MDDTFGIEYTPTALKSSSWDENALSQIEYVYLYWVDLGNTRRCRVIPVDHFKALLRSKRPAVGIGKVGLGLVYLMTANGFTGIGEYLYTLDTSSFRVLHGVGEGDKPVGALFGYFQEKAANPTNGVRVNLCPRTVLCGLERELETKHSASFLIGFESEFILLKSTSPVTPSNVHQWSASAAILRSSPESRCMHAIAQALKASGIPLQMYHAEAAPGQYEVVSNPLTPLAAADALVLTREVITHTAASFGLHATFAPRPFMYSAGSSTHAHISVHNPPNLGTKIPNQLSNYEEAFLAGILDHLSAIAALTLPTPASYKRVADGVWSGGTYVSYGTENREAPVRLTNAASPASRNFELRFIDGTANPYLALAAVLAAGMIGISGKKKLEMQDLKESSAAEMSDAGRREAGITKRLPSSAKEARENLQRDQILVSTLGGDLVDAFLAVSEKLEEALNPEGEDDDQLLTRLVEFY
ncbi:hypothetical protein QCA50_019359 [Cerrena zonata]|uniref:GS catalytic domain-containing protein n=1 Tax=Cerrena zonata TaxID=2478898 RepID=A0AAW0FAS8_9APHY